MANKHISDELLAAYLEGNVNEKEMTQVLHEVGADAELQEILDVALQLEEEQPMLQIAAEGGRNLCDIQCEAYILKCHDVCCSEDELLEVAKDHHWIRRAGTPLQYMGNLLEYHGLKVTRRYDATAKDIKEALESGKSVMVAVDSDKLYPERPDEEDATNHAIVVVDINLDSVNIYDPENINEIDVPLGLFMSAWKESQCYMVCVTK